MSVKIKECCFSKALRVNTGFFLTRNTFKHHFVKHRNPTQQLTTHAKFDKAKSLNPHVRL